MEVCNLAWQTPIFDRTQADVDLVKELTEKIYTQGFSALTTDERTLWLNGLKGALNSIDLNRIEGNIEYIDELLKSYSYYSGISSIKTDWNNTDLDTPNSTSQLNRIIRNIELIIGGYYPPTTSLPLSIANPLHTDINNIEKVLAELLDIVGRMERSFVYSGTSYSGQSLVLPQKGSI